MFYSLRRFVFPDNSNTNVSIQLALNTGEELFDQRKELLEKLNVPTAGEFTVNRGPDCIPNDLLGFARVFNMTKDHLTHWIAQEPELVKVLLSPECDLDESFKEKVWKFLSIRLQLAMRMSGTTLEQDEALLTNQGQKERPSWVTSKACWCSTEWWRSAF
nr:actin-histidine N-methyltransferase-like [Aedes albopictus]